MMLHGNARSCPKSRRLLVERVESDAWSVMTAAEAAGISERTAYRWLRRWREEGAAGCWTARRLRGRSRTARRRSGSR